MSGKNNIMLMNKNIMIGKYYDKAVLECYKRLFAVSEPPADFEKLMVDTNKPCGFELKSNINFMSYTIDEKVCDNILKDIIKEFKIPALWKLA